MKYKDVELPSSRYDFSFFSILIEFEVSVCVMYRVVLVLVSYKLYSTSSSLPLPLPLLPLQGITKQIAVPNPRIFPPKMCVLYPFEIKAALGYLNTMQVRG